MSHGAWCLLGCRLQTPQITCLLRTGTHKGVKIQCQLNALMSEEDQSAWQGITKGLDSHNTLMYRVDLDWLEVKEVWGGSEIDMYRNAKVKLNTEAKETIEKERERFDNSFKSVFPYKYFPAGCWKFSLNLNLPYNMIFITFSIHPLLQSSFHLPFIIQGSKQNVHIYFMYLH